MIVGKRFVKFVYFVEVVVFVLVYSCLLIDNFDYIFHQRVCMHVCACVTCVYVWVCA